MEKEFVNVRLEAPVHEDLAGYLVRLQASVQVSPGQYPKWMIGKKLTMNDALCFLLGQHDKRRARRRKAQSNWPDARVSIPAMMETPVSDEASR